MSQERHYVYLYRDVTGAPRYVGKGTDLDRANSHATSAAHHKVFHDWIMTSEHTVEVSGPFENEKVSAVVESALISCIRATPNVGKHLFNRIEGCGKGCFRPLYVPSNLESRVQEAPLVLADLSNLAKEHGSLLLVYVGSGSIKDRKGFASASLPTFHEIAERIEKYWQLQKPIRDWTKTGEQFPRALIGVAGPGASRTIIASAAIRLDSEGRWNGEKHQDGLITVPIFKESEVDIDYLQLRGRRLSSIESLKFNSFRHSQFKVIGADGHVRQRQSVLGLGRDEP